MSKFKLSDTLQIPVDDAEALIKQYFTEFPKIGGFLNTWVIMVSNMDLSEHLILIEGLDGLRTGEVV